jgi:L-cysteine/cystine lyase
MSTKEKAISISDSEKVSAIRALIPATSAGAYMNAGTNGPLSIPAHKAMLTSAQTELEQGRIGLNVYSELQLAHREARELFAGLFNADPTEIGLMRNTTEGMNVALMGIAWRPGDEIITTQLEHICLYSVLGIVAHRHGVVVRTVDIGNGGGEVRSTIERAISPRTRVIAISHVQWSTGAIMPLKEIAELARERGIITVVDAAQSAGQIPANLCDLGVDAYALSGQKWLCGPIGTGALYVRKDRIGDIRPTYLRNGAFDPHGFVVPPEGAARYEMGDTAGPAIRALNAGLTWMRDEVVMSWAYARVAALGARLTDGLERIKGVAVITPRDLMAGLVSFTVDGIAPKDINDAADKRGFRIRYVDQRPGPSAVRVSTGWWCSEAEIDDFVELIEEFSVEGIG